METTRIKWDESMQTRCLTKLSAYYPETVAAEEPSAYYPETAAVEEQSIVLETESTESTESIENAEDEDIIERAESDFSLTLDMPSASPDTNTKARKSSKWEEFKRAIDTAI